MTPTASVLRSQICGLETIYATRHKWTESQQSPYEPIDICMHTPRSLMDSHSVDGHFVPRAAPTPVIPVSPGRCQTFETWYMPGTPLVCTVRYIFLVGTVRAKRLFSTPTSSSEVSSARLTFLAQTAMVCSLPPEILDIVTDHLHDQPTALRACCLVSKSWVPRSRIHLFARVESNASGPSLKLWMAAFPDPLNSPAHYTRTLTVIGLRFVAGTGNDVTPWIRSFHNVVHLDVETRGRTSFERASLSLFPGLSPAIKSLRLKSLHTPPCTLFDLIYSFSLLEDLTLLALASVPEPDHWTTPSTFPRFTGSLLLSGGIGPITRRLLDLPNGLHFTKIALTFDYEADFKLATDLVSRCSHILESLNVTKDPGAFPSPPVSGRCLTTMIRASHDLECLD